MQTTDDTGRVRPPGRRDRRSADVGTPRLPHPWKFLRRTKVPGLHACQYLAAHDQQHSGTGAVTADNIRLGFARLALVAAWNVAVPWLIFLAIWSVRAFQATNWDWFWFKWSAVLVVPVCKRVSWFVKTVGWVIAGFATPGPELEIEQQAFRAFARDKAALFNVWLIVCWLLVWEAADFTGSFASSYNYSILAGRVTGFLITAILLVVSNRPGSPYCSRSSRDWIKSKNPAAPAVKREAEEDWGKERSR
jgi:hypothetical protein